MAELHGEVVRVATGELVQMEAYQQALEEAGIECKVVGQELDASFGSTLLNSMELYVHEAHFARAEALIQDVEAERERQRNQPTPPDEAE